MKIAIVALAAALVCGPVMVVHAEDALRQPASIIPAALTRDYYYQEDATPSPSDIPLNPSDLGACSSCGGGDSCGGGCSSSGGCEPWRLFGETCRGWTVSGWLAAGVTGNADSPTSRFNGTQSFNDRDEVQINQLYAVVEKQADRGQCSWSFGGRMDLLFGTDYIFTQAAGLETTDRGAPKWNNRRFYGLAMPQLYAEAAYGDLAFKVGHFYTLIGNEVVTAPDNFFYSRAYTQQYGEPFTHTGGLAEWAYSDQLTLYGALVNGWDKFDAETDRTSFLGGFTYTPCHEAYSLAVMFITGDEDGINPPISGNRSMYSVVFNYHVNDRLEYVIQHDNGWQDNGVAAGVNAEWYGLNQYLYYTINDCWKAGARLEWFRDDDGTRVAGIRATNPATGPFVGDFYQVTLGLNWTPGTNLIVRPEVRWDWFDGTGLPFNDSQKDEQFTAAVDAIILF